MKYLARFGIAMALSMKISAGMWWRMYWRCRGTPASIITV